MSTKKTKVFAILDNGATYDLVTDDGLLSNISKDYARQVMGHKEVDELLEIVKNTNNFVRISFDDLKNFIHQKNN